MNEELPIAQVQPVVPEIPVPQLPTVGDLLKDAWNLLRNNVKSILQLEAIDWLIMIIGFSLPGLLFNEPPSILHPIRLLILSVGLVRIALFAGQVSILTSDRSIAFGEAWRHGWHRFFPVVGHGLLLLLIFSPFLTILLYFYWALGVGTLQEGLLVGLGAFVVTLPIYIFLSLRLGFVLYLTAIGETSGAFRESWDLTKGRFWAVFWRFVALGLIVFGINYVIFVIIYSAPALTLVEVSSRLLFVSHMIPQSLLGLYAYAYTISLLRSLQGMRR